MNVTASLLLGGAGNFFSETISYIQQCLANVKVSDFVDIFILAAILFVAFKFLISRKSGVILVGVVIFLSILALSYIFNLDATYFIFSQFVKVGGIVIIIIFQPEIRDALEKMGSGSITGIMNFGDQRKKRQMYYTAIEHICSAVADLSITKTGALIVISRTTKLDDIVSSGVSINANVNSFLIRNLFFNKAPLHDGAVVIDDARIAAAGCLLPLTRRTDVDGDLGTRHRAAIGMSESSDAIIIVVSEETGTISVAYDCTLTRNYTTDSLRKFLNKKMIGTALDSRESQNK